MYTVPVPETKFHQKTRDKLGEAIYLLGYFIRFSEWKTGKLRTNYEKIASEAGFPLGTIKRWMGTLRGAGEIHVLRIPNGIVVTIADYAAIARTRRVPWASDRSEVSNPIPTDRPPAGSREPANEPSDRSEMSMGSSAGELSNIRRILSPIDVQSTSQKASSIDLEGEQSQAAARPSPTRHTPSLGPDQAKKVLEGLGEDERNALMARAMEELESDPLPFYRRFVRRNSAGELEPNPAWQPYVIEIRMAEILMREVF